MKELAKKKWDSQRDEESRPEYKVMRRMGKGEVMKAYDELYERLDTKEIEKNLDHMARQRDRAGKDVQQVTMIKDNDVNVFKSEDSVLSKWKEYFEGMMNEENVMVG